MEEEDVAKLIANSMTYLVGRSDGIPALKNIRADGNEVFVTDTFTGRVFRLTVMETD